MKEDQHSPEQLPLVTVPAVQVVLMREGENGQEVFLGHRIAGGFLDQWSFPGGKIDEGENQVQAAKREVHEETGVEIPEDSLTFLRDTHSSTIRERGGKKMQYEYQMRVFVVDSQNYTPHNASPDEHSEMRWISLGDALSMHERAVAQEQSSGAARSSDKIPGALSPRTLETITFIAERK